MNETPAQLPPLIDSHAHLDSEDYTDDFGAVLDRAREAGLVSIVSIGIEPADWSPTLELAKEFPEIHAAIGVHPNSADQATDEVLAALAERIRSGAGPRVVGLGETGLDYYREYVPHSTQRDAFRAQLALARQLDVPVIIHNRDAHEDVLSILKADGKGTRGVMHSFSGDVAYAEECIALGYMISISGPVTFKKAADKREIARRIPLEQLMVETDCPYLTPEPYRGRRNEPSYVKYTAQAVAALREVPYSVVAEATTANTKRLFGI